ncbi:LysR family transcriptional regulator [Limosilactobacillus secaliphilus]|nr:LysR family transcriptional regulator [Limosilactobacillus secaliphilus]
MNLSQLKYFVEVSKSLNISATARKLHVSQPAISRSLRELEAELGVKLLTQQGRKLILTSQGSFFYSAAEQFLTQLLDASDNVQKIQPANDNQITIKMQQTTPLLVPFIRLIKDQLPGIVIHIIQSDLKNGEQHFDFQLVPAPVANQANDLLIEEEVCLAVCKGTYRKSSIAQRELNDLPLLQLDESPFAEMVKSYLNAQGIHPHYLLRSGDRSLLLHLVEEGYGGCLVPKLSWGSLIDHHKVDLLRIGTRGFQRHIYLSYPLGPRTKTQQTVRNLLLNYCQQL